MPTDVQKVNNLAISNVPEWKPPTEPLDNNQWQPPTSPLKTTPKEEEQPSILSRAWAAANEPLIKVSPEMRQAMDAFSQEHPIMGGIGETGLGALTGLSSPMALGLTALSGGATVAPELATALHIPGRAVSAGMVGHGLYNIYNQPDLGGKIGGGLEAGMGALGLRGPRPTLEPEIIPPSRRLGTGRVITAESGLPERKLLGTGRVINLGEGNKAPRPDLVAVGDEPPYEQPRFKNTEQLRYDIARNAQKMGLDVPTLPKGIRPDITEGFGGHGHPESPEYVGKVLKSVGEGGPAGLSTKTIEGNEHVIYRDKQGNAIAVAKLVKDGDKRLVMDMAADKSKGLLTGRAMQAVGEKLLELGATEPAGTMSPDAQNFLKKGLERASTKPRSFSQFAKNQEGSISRSPAYNREARPEVINKLVDALREAGPKRATQEELYSEARSERIRAAEAVKGSGLKRFYGQLHELKGELPKVDFDSIKVGQGDLNDLLNTVDKSPYLLGYEKIRAKMGLLKMLTKSKAEVPTESELKLLGEVFGKDFDEVIEMHGGLGGPLSKQILMDAANAPKAIMASVDMSAPLRQGLPLIHKKEWWQSIKPMIEAFANEKNYEATMQSIRDRPKYLLGKEAGLSLTDAAGDITKREEAYGSNIANMIPGVKPSERAYVAFLNKLRADTFDSLIDDAVKMGHHPKDVMHEIADFVNIATGRGSLDFSQNAAVKMLGGGKKNFGNLDKVATELNTVLFSPRLMSSRLTMLNPGYYIKASPFVRKEAIDALFSTAMAGLTMTSLMGLMGAKVGSKLSDSKGTFILPIPGTHGIPNMPIDSDFLKARFGNTRSENFGGFLPYITEAGRMLSGEKESSTTGKTTILGKGFNTDTRLSVTEQFAANKLSPVAGLIYKIMKQRGPDGKEYQFSPTMKQSLIDLSNGNINTAIKNAKAGEIGDMFIPMFLGDLIDIYKDDPKHLPLAAGSWFGMGTQTYQPTPRKSTMFRLKP